MPRNAMTMKIAGARHALPVEIAGAPLAGAHGRGQAPPLRSLISNDEFRIMNNQPLGGSHWSAAQVAGREHKSMSKGFS
jgi:hypothetical protein